MKIGANIGSLATPLGNPQNAFILAESGIGPATFVTTLALITLVVLVLTTVVLWSIADGKSMQAVVGVLRMI
ncbi:hypothetical protein [Haladaptatus caseinilyticus]|uniref:hypothetical protein n=1 Tax=Haladaptatus caseinilyticus TaxID=2993314 RepID=UPI00224B8326|nr:hypothetical protein [Haladaptatus caseinilyticus]